MKDAIFYSNYCSYCKQLLELLEKKSIKNKFVPICIDSPNIRLPKMIQQVPTLIIDNKLLVGQNAFEFIMKNFKDEIVETWDGGEMGNFSTAYSYIEENENDKNLLQNFNYLDKPAAKIVTPKDTGGVTKSIDQLMQQRQQEYSKGSNNNMTFRQTNKIVI